MLGNSFELLILSCLIHYLKVSWNSSVDIKRIWIWILSTECSITSFIFSLAIIVVTFFSVVMALHAKNYKKKKKYTHRTFTSITFLGYIYSPTLFSLVSILSCQKITVLSELIGIYRMSSISTNRTEQIKIAMSALTREKCFLGESFFYL